MTPSVSVNKPRLPNIAPTDRELALSVIQAIQLWANPMCRRYLLSKQAGTVIDSDWFAWFTGEWRVARTLDRNSRLQLIQYFNSEIFRESIHKCPDGGSIDIASEHIKSEDWSSAKNGIRVKPISLVSKIAFFVRPTEFAPMDSLSRRGLNQLRGTKKTGGKGHENYARYVDYLSDFNGYFECYESHLARPMKSAWTKPLAKQLGCPVSVINSTTFRRKVFDNLLMQFGRRSRA